MPEAAQQLLLAAVAVEVVGSRPVPDIGQRLGSVQMHGSLAEAMAQVGKRAGTRHIDPLKQVDDFLKALHIHLYIMVDGDV